MRDSVKMSTWEEICIPFWKTNVFPMHAPHIPSVSGCSEESEHMRGPSCPSRLDIQLDVVIIGHFAPVQEEDADV